MTASLSTNEAAEAQRPLSRPCPPIEALHHPHCRIHTQLVELIIYLGVGQDQDCWGPCRVEGALYHWPEIYAEVNRNIPRMLPWLPFTPHSFGWFPAWKEQTLPLLRDLATHPSESTRSASYFARGLLGDRPAIEPQPWPIGRPRTMQGQRSK